MTGQMEEAEAALGRPSLEAGVPPRRFRKTAELTTTELYQRRKRNLMLFCSVVILVALTKPDGNIPIPLLGGEVKLPVELAFIACILTTLYFGWEFYADWETARRRNAEEARAESEAGKALGSELERLVEVSSVRLDVTIMETKQLTREIESRAKDGIIDLGDPALQQLGMALSRIAVELPRWRMGAAKLAGSYRQLHQSVSRLQKANFYFDLLVATALAGTCISTSGYVVLLSFTTP